MENENEFQYGFDQLPTSAVPIAQTNLDTVVGTYEPAKRRSDAYQSEAALEAEFIKMLGQQGYEYLPIHTEADLISNLRAQLEALNGITFTDNEWQHFFKSNIANSNEADIVSKTRKIQEDNVQVLERDSGTSKNIKLIDKKNIHNNRLQVINQYEVSKEEGAAHNNRYDVTILVNGFPLVHVELKRRGVSIKEAFNQIERYQRDSFWASSGLYEYIQVFVISNGTNTKYYSNTTRWSYCEDAKHTRRRKNKTSNSFEFTSFWADSQNTIIPDLVDFTRTFFARHTLLAVLTKYCVFTTENKLLVMRPYQICAVEGIINRIEYAENKKLYGSAAGGGYIWHTTGSGKTLTSFKTARLSTALPYIDKVMFVVDRKDLDYQTMREYDKFEKDCANSNKSTAVLKRQLEDENAKIIITTIQKLSTFIKKNKGHAAFKKRIVFIFDECHRSQFGDMHAAIVKNFKAYNMFGFTGTPIFPPNAKGGEDPRCMTTEQCFGDRLHTYTIVDAINDGNVLCFKVDYVRTIISKDNVRDEDVFGIETEKTYMHPKRIKNVARYVLEHFDQKTYRKHDSGFNAIFAASSIDAARAYYLEFKHLMQEGAEFSAKKLKIATIFSYAPNEAERRRASDGGVGAAGATGSTVANGVSSAGDGKPAENTQGQLEEENSDDASKLDATSREFLESAIADYNEMFHTNYSTDGDKFQSYYKDVSNRMKNREIDMLIVVNMFLTGFDATTLNTLFVDKNLQMHGLIQAFSRTNRILNSVKAFGNVVCFRNLSKQVDEALATFGNNQNCGVVLLRPFEDYLRGYIDSAGKEHAGYLDLIERLRLEFPLSEPKIKGEENQKEFVKLLGVILRLRNLLVTFDEFEGLDTLTPRDLQDYQGRYQDIRDEMKRWRKEGQLTDISDDVVFEMDLVRQIDINIDYILMLVEKYKQEHGQDAEVYVSIVKAVESSPQLRSKKKLIEAFLTRINEMDDVMEEWHAFVAQAKEEEIARMIEMYSLDAALTRKFLENAFRDGEIKTFGTEINALMPKTSLFGNSGHAQKKQAVIDAFQEFFDRFYGIG